ncbi:hypothetical protein A5320_18110 [Rheinheimera sp. SA_1]|nr:hypothetical protein A5320_18110 [Rheinheimera sp. SA_1]
MQKTVRAKFIIQILPLNKKAVVLTWLMLQHRLLVKKIKPYAVNKDIMDWSPQHGNEYPMLKTLL